MSSNLINEGSPSPVFHIGLLAREIVYRLSPKAAASLAKTAKLYEAAVKDSLPPNPFDTGRPLSLKELATHPLLSGAVAECFKLPSIDKDSGIGKRINLLHRIQKVIHEQLQIKTSSEKDAKKPLEDFIQTDQAKTLLNELLMTDPYHPDQAPNGVAMLIEEMIFSNDTLLEQALITAAETGQIECLEKIILSPGFQKIDGEHLAFAFVRAAVAGYENCMEALLACPRSNEMNFGWLSIEDLQGVIEKIESKQYHGCSNLLREVIAEAEFEADDTGFYSDDEDDDVDSL